MTTLMPLPSTLQQKKEKVHCSKEGGGNFVVALFVVTRPK
jgi:hypothetical protein